ncbi:helix-turn-helix transcriptional regulator [Elizabethkingia sp. HX WHF]|uniref:helix-turn-helix domain-containing protein n=1 Tax=Elizabethkingia TaxID=308865 RepID=UPI0005DA427A|nr:MULTISPECIES: helix-turn-helix transcriptional regulator [Elizabethkingia]AJW63235.1 HTH-type transcriptional activator RhaS [Elizabethkingia miricola]ATL45244.1 AraC family transcriptional regulator [Elizabethkingia miricola]MCL1639942.1 helix-turn-helix transcriptional regulator [Elizabethkingia bruuniana]MDX8566103.1 helix-turn-helix transcriptional regulator [Elizabethkingia sp. HX WHF]OPC21741.1 AraC family transcriptional regulator [Elizabethkingia bruuniana]
MERDFISFLTLQDALEILKLQVINKDILTYDLTKQDYHLEENSLYRSDSFCVILVKSGVVSYISNGEYLTLYAGDILFSPILETFSIEYLSDDYVASYILFTEKPITQAGFNYHNLLKELRQGDSLIINGQPGLFARMKFHIGEISRLNSNTLQEYFMEDMISHHFSIILFELSNYIKKDGYSRNLLSRDEEITTNFFTLVKEKYRFEHSVQFYAEQLFITRKYLSKVIKKTMDKTPKDIINQTIIIESKLLLKRTNANISEVAALVGFSDQAMFSKFFKKQSGKSPSEYKIDDKTF